MVVDIGSDAWNCLAWREQFCAHQQREHSAHKETHQHADQIHDTNTLVIQREGPTHKSARVRDVIVGTRSCVQWL